MTKLEQLWPDCARQLKAETSAQQFNTWILPLTYTVDEECLTLYVKNNFSFNFVKEKYLSRIKELANNIAPELVIDLKVGQSDAALSIESIQNDSTSTPKTTKPVKEPIKPTSPSSSVANKTNSSIGSHENTKMNPAFTFESLVSGKGNQLACAAARQIAENPGDPAYNPLFVYGGVGLGKTHLIQAIGNQVFQRNPQAKIRYLHAERYVQDLMRAYQHRAFDEFKQKYHHLDLLLIDDIQFFAGKNRTQEEFFYLFNALIDSGKQVIITCDSIPKQIEGMEERLVSRFSVGLTVEIMPPELEMRVAILSKKAEADGIKLDKNIAFFIAENIRSNVRELEGALKRVAAYTRFTNQSISLEVVKEALKDILAAGNRQVTVEMIQKSVADFYKIKLSDMHSKKRTREIARPRQIAMALAKELTQLSLPNIGTQFGGRDHTTVLHACKTISELREKDPDFGNDYLTLQSMLKN